MAPLAEPVEYEVNCPDCEWSTTAIHHDSEGLEEARTQLLNMHSMSAHSEELSEPDNSKELRP